MASVDWMKLQSGGMRKLAGHYQQELREKLNHSNHHINPEMTKHNFSIGAKDFYEACDKVNARIQEVDKEHPPKRIKKDRVVACSLYVPCPPEICDKGIEASSDFMRKVYAAMEDYFGKENVGGGFVHLDEQHEYIDANTKEKRMSLHHMNVFLPAFVDEDIKTKKGIEHMTGINGKNFVSRKHMKEVNKIMEDICHEYGIEWHTGQGKNHETVETLKAKSAQIERELLEKEVAELGEKKSELIQENTDIQTQVDKGKEQLKTMDYRKELTILDRFFMFVERNVKSSTLVDWVNTLMEEFEKEESRLFSKLSDFKPTHHKKQHDKQKNMEFNIDDND